jgi:sphingomyelin phosphodiesterase
MRMMTNKRSAFPTTMRSFIYHFVHSTNTIFLLIVDIHYDDMYAVGSDAICNEPLCCRTVEHNTSTKQAGRKAGKWGDYNCDLTAVMLDSMLQFISTEISPDIVVWTGDSPPHDIWAESKALQLSRCDNFMKR